MVGEIVFAGIAPHPPLLVPAVGGARITRVQHSADALNDFAQRLIETNPDTVVLISPHSPGDEQRFGAFGGARLQGDFRQFGAAQVKLSFDNDLTLLRALETISQQREIAFAKFPDHYLLDHGVLVPMYYVAQAGWSGPLLSLSFTARTNAEHLEFGRAVRQAAELAGRRIAFIASADLSHYLTEDGPYHFEPQAHLFDEQVCAAIEACNLQAIVEIDPNLRRIAGECGYRSILVAIGAVAAAAQPELLSYEGPFGVGYLTAVLQERKTS